MKNSLDLPPPAAGGNRGPRLDERPYAALERIGRALHGDLWLGKLAADIGEDDHAVRRWRAGQGEPPPETLRRARFFVREHIKTLQRLVEE